MNHISSASLVPPQLISQFQSVWWRSTVPQSKSHASHRRSLLKLAWSRNSGVLYVAPRSSVCTSFACEFVARIACMARTTARHCTSNAVVKARSLRSCGYQTP
jgi:hypothetical protein